MVFISSHREERSPEFLGVSDEKYVYSSFLLSTIQQRYYKSRLHLSIKNALVNEDDIIDNDKVKEGTGKVKQILDFL